MTTTKMINNKDDNDDKHYKLHFQHGISVPASSVVLLNALGYIGFKVVTTCGDSQVLSSDIWVSFPTKFGLEKCTRLHHSALMWSPPDNMCRGIKMVSHWINQLQGIHI